MKATKYKVASEDGCNFVAARSGFLETPPKVGDTVELELDDERQERALLAAAWLEKKEG